MLPELSDKQLDRLSEFCANLGLVYIAAVITPLFTGVDEIRLINVLLGVVLMLISLTASLLLIKGARRK